MSLSRARRLAVLWAVVILLLCSVPGRTLPGAPIVNFDKLVHLGLFAVLGWLLMHAFTGSLVRRGTWTFGLGVLYAVGTEFYQGVLPFERSPDPWDALANTIGLIVAIAVAAYYRRSEMRGA